LQIELAEEKSQYPSLTVVTAMSTTDVSHERKKSFLWML